MIITKQTSKQKVSLKEAGEIVVTNIDISKKIKIPEHSTQKGFINDSIIPYEPMVINLEGVISNLGDYSFIPNPTIPSAKIKYEKIFNDLLNTKELLSLETHTNVYENMRLENWNIIQDTEKYRFTLSFREVFLAKTKTEIVPKLPNNRIQNKKIVNKISNSKTQSKIKQSTAVKATTFIKKDTIPNSIPKNQVENKITGGGVKKSFLKSIRDFFTK